MNNFFNFFKRLTAFLREGSGYSTMRIAMLIMIAAAVFYIVYQALLGLDIDWFGVTGWATVALGGKAIQKVSEVKGQKNNGN